MYAVCKAITENDIENSLNDIFGDVQICGYTYGAGTALRLVDPIAFRCTVSDEPESWYCNECSRTYEEEDDAEACCREGTE